MATDPSAPANPASLARLSMSLPSDLLRHLDIMVEARDMPSRSQMIAQLIRHAIAEHQAQRHPDEMLAGTITLVYRGDQGVAARFSGERSVARSTSGSRPRSAA